MMATFQGDVLLTAFFLNNLTDTGRINYIHSTYVAHQTARGRVTTSPNRIKLYRFKIKAAKAWKLIFALGKNQRQQVTDSKKSTSPTKL